MKNGALGRIRTPDLLIRSQALYPAELGAQAKSGRKVRDHSLNCKHNLHTVYALEELTKNRMDNFQKHVSLAWQYTYL